MGMMGGPSLPWWSLQCLASRVSLLAKVRGTIHPFITHPPWSSFFYALEVWVCSHALSSPPPLISSCPPSFLPLSLSPLLSFSPPLPLLLFFPVRSIPEILCSFTSHLTRPLWCYALSPALPTPLPPSNFSSRRWNMHNIMMATGPRH